MDQRVVSHDCSYDLYFDAEQTAGVLLDVGRLAHDPAAHRSNLILPGGRLVSVPFLSWVGDRKTLPLEPGGRVHFEAELSFPLDPAGEQDLGEPTGPGGAQTQPDSRLTIPIRLRIYLGQRHTRFAFSPRGLQTCRLFLESAPVRAGLFQILKRQQGILGLLHHNAGQEAYLLPDLRRRIDTPSLDLLFTRQGLDVDGWLDALLEQPSQPTSPPAVVLPEEDAEEWAKKVLKRLRTALGIHRGPIPQRYYRTFEEKPFDTCDFCASPLLASGREYTITKLFVEGELRQELATCSECAKTLEKGYSAESREASWRMMAEVSPLPRLKMAADESIDRAAEMTRHCLLCNTPREEALSYAEYVECDNDEIVYRILPCILCEDCIVRMNDALSEKTKDAWRRFYDEHFGWPPSGLPARRPEHDLLSLWSAW